MDLLGDACRLEFRRERGERRGVESSTSLIRCARIVCSLFISTPRSKTRSLRNEFTLKTKRAPISRSPFPCFNPGGDLRSRVVSNAVSSALRGLTSVFGMGTGVTLAVIPPRNLLDPARPFLQPTRSNSWVNFFVNPTGWPDNWSTSPVNFAAEGSCLQIPR